MKKNDLYKVTRFSIDRYPAGIWSLMLILLVCQKGQAQEDNKFVNEGEMRVVGDTLSIHFNFDNLKTGKLVNDGNVFVFADWYNDGDVTYSNSSKGKTFFTGDIEQKIEGRSVTNFQNLILDNTAALTPIHLGAIITINDKATFINGVVDASLKNSKVVFNENASHTDASDLSFIDGRVEKKGNNVFEFPVGNDLYFRPSYHAVSNNIGDIYTTQYFYKNSDDLHKHSIKDESILVINDKEYWNVTKDQGDDKIILSLTLDSATTPPEFFNLNEDTKIVIVRWDDASGMWVNEKGEVDPFPSASKGTGYTQLLTSQVSGYGIFTMALVKKDAPTPLDVIVYNAISPNGDGINDTFLIKGINQFPDNTVEIYNRWGVRVYEAKSYNESDVMFTGYSDGRVTVNKGEKLPTGTYFYILKYNNGEKGIEKAGYLYINNQ
ncbi:gliding motility-associated C-terminal domain-containing protein [Flavobacterium sp. LS1R49]|uniref:Gliding motility-associated C-terminal domain-containing protein n=1 Tax=Flavobacterium shii TaxID=2987687 RepID=A0A9X2YVG0_9FLAO|nr:gliding motility-associated C-terminal domain-containing protein [Flavobacterium shii]MCV9928548.1 gliding motility-associated C-terminal domain-containing protein [Flavobacterium shii]